MFQFGDWVQIKYGEYEEQYAKVANRRKTGEFGVLLYDGVLETVPDSSAQPGKLLYFSEEALALCEPYRLSQKELRKVVRAELTYSDFAEKVFPPFNLRAERKYTLKVEDIRAALTNINKNKSPLDIFKQWFWLILNVFYDSLNIKKRYDEALFTDFPKDEKEIFSTVYSLTEKLYWRLEERLGSKEESEQYMIRFQNEPFWEKGNEERNELEEAAYHAVCADIIGRIDSYTFNLDKPQGQWYYSASQMKHVISSYESEKDLQEATPEALALYREFVRRLYRTGDLQAVRVLAFGYMEGGIAYRKNYELAKIYMQELYDKAGDAFAANCLGILYYYGLTNHGIPQYDKAFHYFSYGVLDGIDESIYMAADMLLHGQGTVKNIDMGLNLLVDGYRNTLYEFCHGTLDCRFAEYAMYMGKSCLEGLIYGMGIKDAYRFFLEAEYAARMRKDTENPADPQFMEKVNQSLEYIREKVGLNLSQTELKADFPIYIGQLYEDHYPVRVSITQKKNSSECILRVGKFDLRDFLQNLGLLPEGEAEKGWEEDSANIMGQLLVTYPELSWSGLVTELEFLLEGGTILKLPEKPGPFLSDGFRRDDATNALEFFFHGDVVAAVEADWYTVKVDKKGKKNE